MNGDHLSNEIIRYVFDNFGIYNSKVHSIQSDVFLTNERLSFKDDNDKLVECPIWACEAPIYNSKFQIISCRFDSDKEAALLVRLEGCPIYGCYLAEQGFIACQAKDKWLPANMFITASFLAGVEQLREIGAPFEKIEDVNELVKLLKGFISFYDGCNA